MAGEQIFHVGVKALIQNTEGQVLLLKADVSTHKKNVEVYWDIPGGRIQKGSSVLQTLAREIEEETGIVAFENPTIFGSTVSKHEIPVSDELTVGLLLVVYKVTVADDVNIVLSPEHTDYEWVSGAEAASRLNAKYPKEFTGLLSRA